MTRPRDRAHRGSASVRSRARGCGSCARYCAREGSIRPTCSKVQWFPSLQAAKIFDDEDHPGEEQREIIIGHSTHEHLLLVSLTQREGAIRIISARKATRHERKDYEVGVSRDVVSVFESPESVDLLLRLV